MNQSGWRDSDVTTKLTRTYWLFNNLKKTIKNDTSCLLGLQFSDTSRQLDQKSVTGHVMLCFQLLDLQPATGGRKKHVLCCWQLLKIWLKFYITIGHGNWSGDCRQLKGTQSISCLVQAWFHSLPLFSPPQTICSRHLVCTLVSGCLEVLGPWDLVQTGWIWILLKSFNASRVFFWQ